MTAGGGARSLTCRDVGFPCEWGIRGSDEGEILSRFRDHAKCAHALPELTPEIASRARAAVRRSE